MSLGRRHLRTQFVCPLPCDSCLWRNIGGFNLGTGLQTLGMFSLDFDGDVASGRDESGAGTEPNAPEESLAITAAVNADNWTSAEVTISWVPGGDWQDAGPGVFTHDAVAKTIRSVTWPGTAGRFFAWWLQPE